MKRMGKKAVNPDFVDLFEGLKSVIGAPITIIPVS